MSTIPELLNKGFQLHRDNQLAEARQIYEQVIELDANHTGALNLLGLVGWQTGQFAQAVEHLRKAIELDGSQAAFFANLAEAYRGLGRLDKAIENYERAVHLQPSTAAVHVQRASLLEQTGEVDRAIAGYHNALEHEPECFDALVRLGYIHVQQGRLPAAEECYRLAAKARPDAAAVHYEIGNLCRLQGRMDDAIAGYRQAVMLQPDDGLAHCSLGMALREQRRASEALPHLQRAVTLRPDMPLAHNNLGTALHDLVRLDEAQSCFQRAVELEPQRGNFLFNLATAQQDQGRVEEAIASYTRAIEAEPGYAQALWSRGTALLSLGRFGEGWSDYEYRVDCPESHNTLKFEKPSWDGSPLADRRLLIHGEQGFGDTLQFIRYLPLVRKRVPGATIAAYAALVPLLEQSGYAPLVSLELPLPPFDVHAPLMSLPRIFGTELDSVPADVPYLSVEEARVERWRAVLKKHEGFKVGIAWQGRTSFRLDPLRSIPLERFAPLAQVAGVRLVSLQKGPGTEQVAALAGKFEVVDLDQVLDVEGAFLDTAAAMQCLDLVIASDSAVAHLAGALGVPVWLALSLAPDWRWMVDRDDSPWYPTMRLFRQTERGQWPDVFARMALELQNLIANLSCK